MGKQILEKGGLKVSAPLVLLFPGGLLSMALEQEWVSATFYPQGAHHPSISTKGLPTDLRDHQAFIEECLLEGLAFLAAESERYTYPAVSILYRFSPFASSTVDPLSNMLSAVVSALFSAYHYLQRPVSIASLAEWLAHKLDKYLSPLGMANSAIYIATLLHGGMQMMDGSIRIQLPPVQGMRLLTAQSSTLSPELLPVSPAAFGFLAASMYRQDFEILHYSLSELAPLSQSNVLHKLVEEFSSDHFITPVQLLNVSGFVVFNQTKSDQIVELCRTHSLPILSDYAFLISDTGISVL